MKTSMPNMCPKRPDSPRLACSRAITEAFGKKRARFWVLLGLVVALIASDPQAQPLGSARADDAVVTKKIFEQFDAAYLSGAQSGWFRTRVDKKTSGKGEAFVTTLNMNLQIKRYGSVVSTKMDTSTTEDAQGKIQAMTLTQHLDMGEALTTARIEGSKMFVKAPGAQTEREIPFDTETIGPRKQEALLREKKVQPGDSIKYKSFEASLLMVTNIEAKVRQMEEIDVFVVDKDDPSKVERKNRKLLRIDVIPEPIKILGTPLQLPSQAIWVDENYDTLRSRTEMPGMGVLHLFRTSKEAATKPGTAPELLPDLGTGSAVVLAKRIPDVTTAKVVKWKLTLPDEENPTAAFALDDRQSAGPADRGSFVLTVKSGRDEAAQSKPVTETGEFKEACYYLDSDDATVRGLAILAVGRETDPWQKAVKIEQFVNKKMKTSSDVGFATASQVARTLTGDCRQHAMLAAAMCRAVDVPSRTALGLVYVDQSDKAILGFHMWMEVLIDGKWRGLDPIFGLKGLTPGHIKICDHSWKNTQTLAPLLPVLRVMGKLQAQIVEVE